MEALKTLKMAQLISIGKVRSPLPCFHCLTYADIEQTSPLAKYTHPLLIYLFKSTSYHAFISAYPQSTELLHEIYDKVRQTLSAVSPRCSSLARLTHPLIEKNYLCNTLEVRIKRRECPNIRRRDFDVLGPATTVHEGTGSCGVVGRLAADGEEMFVSMSGGQTMWEEPVFA